MSGSDKWGITRQDLLMGPPCGQEIHDEFNRNPGPGNHGLADENLRVDYDSFSQFHVSIIH